MAATRKLDLRTGTSLWQARPLRSIGGTRLKRQWKGDVIIVGSGISGALAADLLSEAGLKVIVLDRRPLLSGSTVASTALLQYEIDVPLILLSKQIGQDRAERIWRRSRLAVDALDERQRHLGIKADVVQRDSLYLQGNILDSDGLRAEYHARMRAGFEVSFLPSRTVRERYGIRRRAAILGYHNLAADPRRLAAGFLRAAMARGATAVGSTELTDIEPSQHSVTIHTSRGIELRSRALIFATGYELPKGVPRKRHSISSTWVFATAPQARLLWPSQCLIWEASEPYLYVRTTCDGRVICGGEDEEFSDEASRDALLAEKVRILQRKLGRLLPGLKTDAEYMWCGAFGASRTGVPSIGPIPKMPNCYAVLGYGGNGITFSMMAAQMLRGLITGTGDPDLDLVSFGRRV